MPESERITITRLNDSNYAEWAIRMEAVLIRQALWDMVDIVVDTGGKDEEKIIAELEIKKGKRTKDRMAEARAEMILRVEDGQLVHMMSRDPMEIWQKLEKVHLAVGFATSLALRRKFLTTKKSETMSMQAWIGHIEGLAFRMEKAGIIVTEQDKILAVTMGLPPAYNNVIINFDSMSPDLLTMQLVITRLLNEEAHQEMIADEPKPKEESLAAVSRTKTRTTDEITCYFCDKKGHYKSDCPERKLWERTKKNTDKVNFAIESDVSF